MTTSITATATGMPRRRFRAFSRRRQRPSVTITRARQSAPVPEPKPMTFEELDAWITDHAWTMDAAQDDLSATFVLHVQRLSGGRMPEYLRSQIDPASIVSGEHDDRVFIRFSYFNGGVVTLYPGFDYQAYLQTIDRMLTPMA